MRPLNCERSRQWISLSLDGMLSSFESALLRRHLSGCADCRAFDTAARAETALLRSAPLEAPLAPVTVSVRRGARHARFALAPVAATAAAVAAAAVFLSPAAQQTPVAHLAGADLTAQASFDALTNITGGTQNLGVQRRIVRRPQLDARVRGVYGLPA
jgi:hypothetical protein